MGSTALELSDSTLMNCFAGHVTSSVIMSQAKGNLWSPTNESFINLSGQSKVTRINFEKYAILFASVSITKVSAIWAAFFVITHC